MSNDDLLRALGRLSARQAEDDERPLPAELAGPPTAATRQHLADQALAALAPTTPAPIAVAHRRPAREAPGEGWFQRLVARRTLLLATPALGAAALGLLFLRGGDSGPLPAYTMQLSGGVASVRGDAPETGARPLELAEGSRVELRLRPERPIDAGGVAVQLFWTRGTSQLRWFATTEISPQGAVRIVGSAPRPFGPGEGELVVTVGRPGGARQSLRAPVRWR
jgi:hypothetical protein